MILTWIITDFGSFTNYTGVEEDNEAFDALESYYEKGFMLKFRTLDDVERHLGCKPTLSKLGCIKKMKYNPDTDQYTYKARIILDCKRSGVSKRAQRTHKSVLPRATDAILSVLHLMAQKQSGQDIQLFIADIVDAFWLIPLHVSERRYFCAHLRGQYYLFTRTAQGSRMAPLTFAAIMSVASRWVQSLSNEYAMQVYVDDPLVAILAEPHRTKRLACVIASAWMIMGFPLAFHKATLAPQLVWIGVQLEVKDDTVVAEIPASKVSELIKLLKDTLGSNLVSIKSLRSLTGKLTSVASVIQVWRPFVQQLYKAMHVVNTKELPKAVSGSNRYSIQCHGFSPSWLENSWALDESSLWTRIFAKDQLLSSHGMQAHMAWGLHYKSAVPLSLSLRSP